MGFGTEGCCLPTKEEPLQWGNTLVEILGEELGRARGGRGGKVVICRETGDVFRIKNTCLESDPPSLPAAATDGDKNTPAPVSCLLSPEGQALVKALFKSSAI